MSQRVDYRALRLESVFQNAVSNYAAAETTEPASSSRLAVPTLTPEMASSLSAPGITPWRSAPWIPRRLHRCALMNRSPAMA